MNTALPSVHLRAMEPEDLDLLYRIENDRLLWNVGTTNVPYSRYTLHDYIANASGDIYTDCQVRLMIENEEGQTLGIADSVNFDPKHRRAELGVVIECAYRRKGYAQAALLKLSEYALRHLHLHQLYVCISVDNEPSLHLFRKMGYQHSATLRDWLFDGCTYHDAVVMQLLLISSDAGTPNK